MPHAWCSRHRRNECGVGENSFCSSFLGSLIIRYPCRALSPRLPLQRPRLRQRQSRPPSRKPRATSLRLGPTALWCKLTLVFREHAFLFLIVRISRYDHTLVPVLLEAFNECAKVETQIQKVGRVIFISILIFLFLFSLSFTLFPLALSYVSTDPDLPCHCAGFARFTSRQW